MNLYLTADRIGIPTGGGLVTHQELLALKALGPVQAISLTKPSYDPFEQDQQILARVKEVVKETPQLAHCYAGCLTETVAYLKSLGTKVTYTAAAHDIQASKRAHEDAGLPFHYPHLTDPGLWARYVAGYLSADVVVCPSMHSKVCMESYGARRVEVIPHGVDGPNVIHPLPSRFTVGYLGAYGPDKGVRYLLEAWKELNYRDGLLILAGRDSTSPYVRQMVEQFGGGNIHLMGWVDSVADFYNAISLYVQPSITEGFGCEVLEALAYNRAVLCSDGAGASDVVPEWYRFVAGDVEELESKIDQVRMRGCCQPPGGYPFWKDEASKYTWYKVRLCYIYLWRSL
jgi:glycosyltransferase involved in cell wall biosynthesis